MEARGSTVARGADERLDRHLKALASDAAALAALRRAVGKQAGDAPEAWPYVVPLAGESVRRLEALTQALALFALHQQSRVTLMHELGGPSLGEAARLLRARRREGQGVERRFLAAATAQTPAELAHHLRGLVTLLRGEEVRLDWCRLARELERWHEPRHRARIRRRWGLDFYAQEAPAESEEGGGDQDEQAAGEEGETG